MKVLLIDDDPISIKGIVDFCAEKTWENKVVNFDEAYSQIMEFDPDVIILDWRRDADDINAGANILDKVWNITFRPIIVFSANGALIDIAQKQQESNMIKLIGKGDEGPVIDYLQSMEKFAPAISNYRKDLSGALIASMNSIDYLKRLDNIEESAIGYILSKRTSVCFDNQYLSALSPSWVQYIYPPMDHCLNVCDVIRKKGSETNPDIAGNPDEYFLILTPSCDLYRSSDKEIKKATDEGRTEEIRTPKVTHVLCAHCCSKEQFHNMQLDPSPRPKNIEKVQAMLSQGYHNSMVALPKLANIIPSMAVDLKKLELIPIDIITCNNPRTEEAAEYYRVTSIFSPFREQLIWAHMPNSCRPGVPDRNFNLWSTELLST